MSVMFVEIAGNTTVTFWDSLAGGNQITDLTDGNGNAISSVTTDSYGEFPEFYGPAGVWRMAADAFGGAGPRRWVQATDMGDELTGLNNDIAGLSPLGGVVTGGVPVWNGAAWQCQLVTDVSVDPQASIQVSKLAPGAPQAQLLTSGLTPAWVPPGQGSAVLNGTTAVVVPAAAVTANSRIFLTIQTPGGTPGSPYVSTRTAGVSFSVKSQAGDTSTCAWVIVEPGT